MPYILSSFRTKEDEDMRIGTVEYNIFICIAYIWRNVSWPTSEGGQIFSRFYSLNFGSAEILNSGRKTK